MTKFSKVAKSVLGRTNKKKLVFFSDSILIHIEIFDNAALGSGIFDYDNIFSTKEFSNSFFFVQCHHVPLWTSWSTLLGMVEV